jgi:hypothetical protein
MLVFLLGRSGRLLAGVNIRMLVDHSYLLDRESCADERWWCSCKEGSDLTEVVVCIGFVIWGVRLDFMLRGRQAGPSSSSLASLTRKRMELPRLHSWTSMTPCTAPVIILTPCAIEYEFTRRIRSTSETSNIKL